MTFKRLLLPAVLALAAAAPGHAQMPPAQPPLFSFRAVAWNRELPDSFYEVDGHRRPLSLHRGSISQEQTFTGEPRLTLFDEIKAADGRTRKIPLTRFELKRPPAKNLVIVWVAKNGSCQSMVLADQAETLPPGHARFVNVTDRRLAIDCNRATCLLPPGGQRIVAASHGGLGIKVAVQIQSHGGWKLAAMDAVRVRPDTRVTVFIADPSQLATPPEDENKEIVARPLSLFVLTDHALPHPPAATSP